MNLICEKCGTSNPGNVKFCKQCGNQLIFSATPTSPDESPKKPDPGSRRPIFVAGPSSGGLEGQRYSTLRSIAAICRLFGYVFGGLGVISGLIGALVRLSDSFFTAMGC